MKSKAKKLEVRALETLGHRVDPAVKVMLDEVAERWGRSRRAVLEEAIRDLHRAVITGGQR